MYGSSTCVITQSVLVWLGGPVPRVASDFSDEGPCSPVVASCGCTDYYPDTMQGREVDQCIIILCIVCICVCMHKVASL